MPSCSAFGCTNRPSKKTAGITFHRFPKDPKQREEWTKAVSRKNWQPSKHSNLCSVHFPPDMFDRSSLCYVRLRENAVPSIFEIFSSDSRKKSAEKTLAEMDPCETSPPSFEPEIVIKEEPIDIDETQIPSTSRTEDEFILPGWTPTPSGHTPALGVAFTVVKTEEGTANGKTGLSSESQPSEDDSNKDRTKDHFDAYGEYIAAKLRKLDWKSCAHVQKAIGDIIFEAEMGKYK